MRAKKRNKYTVLGAVVKVEIESKRYGNVSFLVDFKDWFGLQLHKRCFRLSSNGYVVTSTAGNNMVALHTILFPDSGAGVIPDHINRDKLDNTRKNLRLVTNAVNLVNRGVFKTSKSGITGVCWDADAKKWLAHIRGLGVKRKRRFVWLHEAIECRKAWEAEIFAGICSDG